MSRSSERPRRPASPARPRRPRAIALALTAAGRHVLVLALGATLVGAFAAGAARPLAALAAALLALATLLALAGVSGLELGPPRPARGAVGSRLLLDLAVRRRARLLAPRRLVFALAEDRGDAVPGDAPSPAGVLAGVLAHEPRSVALVWRPRRRGEIQRLWAFATASDPLGLVTATRAFELPAEVLALPRRGRLARAPEPRAGRGRATSGRAARGEEELDHVRDWRPGESLHRVHWRLSARRGRPILRELRAPAEGELELELRTRVAPLLVRSRDASFERAVSLAATLANHYLRRGRRLALSIEGEGTLRGLRGRGGLARALERLARVEAQSSPGDEPAPQRPRGAREAGELVVVLAGGGGESPGRRPRAQVFDVDAPPGHPQHAPLLGGNPGRPRR